MHKFISNLLKFTNFIGKKHLNLALKYSKQNYFKNRGFKNYYYVKNQIILNLKGFKKD